MTSGRMEGEIAGLLEDFRGRMRDIAEAQRERVKLTATATTRDKTVSVTVNANGVVIETRFSDRVDELSYDQIAKAVTRMAQQAADEVFAKSKALAAPLFDERARLPKLSDVIPGMPDIEAEIPMEPPVSLSPPGSSERAESDEVMTFTDVESYDHGGGRGPTESVAGQAW
ncbi:YbaB/EbfC DNA-binding family protein [Nocardia amikacinitolerans]|uniref:YbaB/EbfC family nucleoid-associated protein n=1 Tax=Nocardia amikacinitolerans TaxID=756689 RepID=UPI000AB6A8CE|nr:YbaB/EbfC family nucleoid-associated protein [Nocardia amikacinitolerans]MCP2317554.1 YbaB/EbfC DNA-binding family protein [Nocardia amikacinitolerans]